MLVDTVEKFAEALRELKALPRAEPIVVDTETTGLDPWRRENPDRMVGISMTGLWPGLDAKPAYYFTFRHAEGANLPIECLQELRDFLRDREQVFHNAGYDVPILWLDGFDVPTSLQDTIVAAHLCNENEGDEQGFGLKALGVKYLGADADAEEKALAGELKARKLKGKGQRWKLPAALVAPYAIQDVVLTRDLYWNRFAELNRWRLLPLFKEVNRYLLALIRMHIRGVKIDREEILRQSAETKPRMLAAEARIKELAGFDINVNSSQQLQKWLGLSTTNKKYLEELVKSTPREDLQLLLTYRALAKADSTFFIPFQELADALDRLHTSYRLTIVTGRISASKPNLQQLTKNRVGSSIRSCITSSPGTFLVELDFSTIEPRVAAHLSNDPTMRAAFLDGVDFHASVAKRVYNDPSIGKNDPRRDRAKTIGLGCLYNMGSFKTAQSCNLLHEKNADGSWKFHHEEVWAMVDGQLAKVACSRVSEQFCTCEGREWRRKYFDAVPELEPFSKLCVQKATDNNYIRNPISSRVRRFVGKRSPPHKALNSLVQGAAADVLRKALVAVDEEFGWEGHESSGERPRLVLCVHDSLVLEVPFGPNAEQYVRRIKEIMETTTVLSVPTPVDVKFGISWGALAEFK
jgi:DNA polymerase-1